MTPFHCCSQLVIRDGCWDRWTFTCDRHSGHKGPHQAICGTTVTRWGQSPGELNVTTTPTTPILIPTEVL